MLNPADFDYDLPPRLIARSPLSVRDRSRLLVVNRQGGLRHCHFSDLVNLLTPGDVLVLNRSKVFPARLMGRKSTGGSFELLLTRQTSPDTWEAISRPRLKAGTDFFISPGLSGRVSHSFPETGLVCLRFNQTGPEFWQVLNQVGRTPIPPYISTKLSESKLRRCYQTVYARQVGSAAAPTAGLHFTAPLLAALKQKGVQIEYITLHVGLGTFQPLRPHHLQSRHLHPENYHISPSAARRLNQAKSEHRRIIAVGTTAARCLESAVSLDPTPTLKTLTGETTLFIYPPYQLRFVDSLITNFHLPQTSLLMLVVALASSPNTPQAFLGFTPSVVGQAYAAAINRGYRFYSFGDAMWIY